MKIQYSDNYYADIGMHIFPMHKYALVKNMIENSDLPIKITESKPIDDIDILRVHEKKYLEAMQTGVPESLAQSNEIKWSLDFLKSCLFQTGGTYESAKLALNERVSGNIGGGFHHAKKENGSCYCTFNDLAIAIKKLQSENMIKKALVLDCDLHYGDGTAKIFKNDDSVFTFSLYGKETWAVPFKSTSSKAIKLKEGTRVQEYIEILSNEFNKIIEQFQPNLILYNAGADVHNEDPMSNLDMSTSDLAKKDELVLQTAKQNSVPITITLGGGYNRDISKVVEIHFNTFKKACEVFSN